MAKGIKMHETTLKVGMISPYKCKECDNPLVVKENKSGQAFLACPLYGKGCDGFTMTLTQDMILPILDLNDVPPPLSQFGAGGHIKVGGSGLAGETNVPGGGGGQQPEMIPVVGGTAYTSKSGVYAVQPNESIPNFGTPGGGGVTVPYTDTDENWSMIRFELGPETQKIFRDLIKELGKTREMIKDKTTW